MVHRGRHTQQFAAPVPTKHPIPPPESNPWWWHPARVGMELAPGWFQRELDRVDPELSAVKNKLTDEWGIFMKKPSIATKTCWGWALLFTTPFLGPHVAARLYEASARRWGSGREYFAAIEREIERDRETSNRKSQEYAVEKSREVYDYSQIKNIGLGSKFSTYHA